MPISSTAILFVLSLLLTACGGSGGSNSPAENSSALKGTFFDAPVSGLNYQTKSLSGVTDAEGRFEYQLGETISFSIRGVLLGEVEAADIITPYDMFPYNVSESTSRFNNLLRLLQSLDEDCNPDNGITLNAAVKTRAEALNLPLPETIFEFENNTQLLSLLELSNCNTSWVTTLQAESHLRASMTSLLQPSLQEIAVLTLDGESQARLAMDSDGNSIYVVPADAAANKPSQIITRSEGEYMAITLDELGFPVKVVFPNGTIMLTQNHNGETVDVILDIPKSTDQSYPAARILKRVILSDTAKSAFYAISPNSNQTANNFHHLFSTSLAQLSDDANEPILSKIFSSIISSAYAGSTTQELSEELIKASQVITYTNELNDEIDSYLKEANDFASFFFGSATGKKYLSNIATSIINGVIDNATKNSIQLDQDSERVVQLVELTQGCVSGSFVSCVQADLEAMSAVIELGGILYDIQEDSDRIAENLAELEQFNWEEIPPFVSLNSPNDGDSFAKNELVVFQGNAFDLNEDNIPDSRIFWKSSQQGDLGTGRIFSINNLSPGVHIITMTAEAINGDRVSRRVSIEVDNKKPVATIITPSLNDLYLTGTDITLSGTGIDPEDGNLTGVNLEWRTLTDNRFLGTGSTIFVNDLLGPRIGDAPDTYTHTIILTVTDKNGKKDTDSVVIKVSNALMPVINIPILDGTYYNAGESNQIYAEAFSANGDVIDGSNINWKSNIDGNLYNASAITSGDLRVGEHTLTATVCNLELCSSDTVVVIIAAYNPVEVSFGNIERIYQKDDGDVITPVTTFFDVDVTDAAIITWSSNIDGQLSAGSSLAINTLSKGDHIIEITSEYNGDVSNPVKIAITIEGPFVSETINFKGLNYITIKSPYSNQVWLDRNLGANKACASADDVDCFGDYYQWGRSADGHEAASNLAAAKGINQENPADPSNISDIDLEQASSLTNIGIDLYGGFDMAYSGGLDGSVYHAPEGTIGELVFYAEIDWTTADPTGATRKTNWSKGYSEGGICPDRFRVPTRDEMSSDLGPIARGAPSDVAFADAISDSFLMLGSSSSKRVSVEPSRDGNGNVLTDSNGDTIEKSVADFFGLYKLVWLNTWNRSLSTSNVTGDYTYGGYQVYVSPSTVGYRITNPADASPVRCIMNDRFN